MAVNKVVYDNNTLIDITDTTATANDVINEKYFYTADGVRTTGTLETTSGIYTGAVEGNATISDYSSVDYGMQVLEINAPIEDEDWEVGTKYVIDDTGEVTVVVPSRQVASSVGLTANKLKKNERVLGITGTYEGLDTSDATAMASDIVTQKTAYVNGSKITGTLQIQKYYTGSTEPSSSLGNNGDIYLKE